MTPQDLKKFSLVLRDFHWSTRWLPMKEQRDTLAALIVLCESLAEPTKEMVDAAAEHRRMGRGYAQSLLAMLGAIEVPK